MSDEMKAADPIGGSEEDVPVSVALVDHDQPPAEEKPAAAPEEIAALQARIDQLDAIKKRQAVHLRVQQDKIADLNGQLRPAALPEKPVRPQVSAYTEDADFEAAMHEYESNLKSWLQHEARQEFDMQRSEERAQEMMSRDIKRAQEQEIIFRDQVSDYHQATSVFNNFVASVDQSQPWFQHLQKALFSSENVPAAAYHLGKNPEMLEACIGESDSAIDRLMGRIDARVHSLYGDGNQAAHQAIMHSADSGNRTQNKPKPINPVGGQSKPSRPLEAMSAEELVRWVHA